LSSSRGRSFLAADPLPFPSNESIMKARYKVIGASLSAVLFMVILLAVRGYDATWDMWNVVSMTPHFSDLRVITHGAESHALGLDPMREDPADPWQRKLNYPRVWQLLYSLGINQSHTTALGLLIVGSFLIGVCLVLPNAANLTLFLVFAAVLSPATLLGVERANIDLLMFFLVSLSVLAGQWSAIAATLILLAGCALKFFPVLGWAAMVKTGRSSFVKLGAIVLCLVGIYLLASRRDLALIDEATPRSTFLSYGFNVYWMALREAYPSQAAVLKPLSYVCAPLIFVMALSALFRPAGPPEPPGAPLALDAFRAGSAIYVGTFLMGNNWDYRLVFLILTLPQLVLWSRSRGRLALVAKVVIGLVLLSFWHMLIVKWLRPLANGYLIGLTIDEVANWAAFAGLAWLLFWSAPDWVSETARRMLPGTR